MACRSRSRVTGPVALAPDALSAVPAKERGAAFGPPRDGFGLFLSLLDGGEQHTGESFQGEGIGAGCEDEFTKLGLLPILQRSGFILEPRAVGPRARKQRLLLQAIRTDSGRRPGIAGESHHDAGAN